MVLVSVTCVVVLVAIVGVVETLVEKEDVVIEVQELAAHCTDVDSVVVKIASELVVFP